MHESFSIKSRDGRREVTAYLDGGGLTQRGWRISFTKSTATRSETRDGWTRTKTEARRRASEFCAAPTSRRRAK